MNKEKRGACFVLVPLPKAFSRAHAAVTSNLRPHADMLNLPTAVLKRRRGRCVAHL
ncbi:MAG: hypothetical protein J6X70_06995 [Muribaculaceae bacterium]|nr:hypothetical protein [Muribaculaceae bacterium]